MARKVWSNEEMEFIKNNLANMTISELANHFDVSYAKMNDKVHKMGLSRKKASGEIWSNEEDELLRKHFEWAPKNYIMKLFPNRTWVSILQRGIKTLNLNRQSQDRYSVDYKFFEEWTPESAYIFGFIAADGHLFYESGKENKNALQFEIADYDSDILEKIKKVLQFEGPICYTKRNTVKLQLSNKKIINDLIEKGMPKENKTSLLSKPIDLPDHLVKHYIRGLFDGDGSVYQNGATDIRYQLLGTLKLLTFVKEKLPCDCSNITIRNRAGDGANVHCFQTGHRKAKIILNWMYKDSTIHLDRKYNKYKEILKAIELNKER